MNYDKKILKGLDHTWYEHDFDKKALAALENTPGLAKVGTFITTNVLEKVYSVQYTGSNLKVTKSSYPKMYEYLEYACEILDLPKIPEFYIQWGYDVNAMTIGAENPIIVINSGLIDLCNDDEILFVLGHEIGHIKSYHMLYHMMAQVINDIVGMIDFGKILSLPLQYALYYWSRMSEFTADRAGLLCCQNMKSAVSAFIKMAGMPQREFKNINCEAFIEQALAFKQLDYDAMNKIVKFVSIADESHPWVVMRAAELLRWTGLRQGIIGNTFNQHLLSY